MMGTKTTTYLLDIFWFRSWLREGERGESSEAIVEHLTGKPVGGKPYAERFGRLDHPADAGDFRRCELLLRAVPMARQEFPRMARVSPEWAALVGAWGDIVREAEAERPDIFTNTTTHFHAASSQRIYDVIRQARSSSDPSKEQA